MEIRNSSRLATLCLASLVLSFVGACGSDGTPTASDGGSGGGGGGPLQSDPDVTLSSQPPAFTLQILHAADQEAGTAAVSDIPRFSSVLNALAPEFPNTVKLTSGDLWIPGPFYNVTGGETDVLINSALGFQVAVLGNHEFDFGTGTLAGLLENASFPYLGANLDFFLDDNLAELEANPRSGADASTIPGQLAKSVVVDVNGELLGVVGATTPLLPSISQPGDVGVNPADPTDLASLAAILQPEIDALTASGINKIVLLAHLQQIQNEITLAGLVRDVDVIIAGGSDTLLADPEDRIRTEFGKEPSGDYPLLYNSASGEPIALVNTDREYRYVGRLVVDFDDAGILTGINDLSGPYPADDQGVAETGNAPPDPEVVALVDEVAAVLLELDGPPFYGSTAVFLNGERQDVRSQETNLGNLTADANLARARAADPSVAVSIKNGGGIRASIGAVLPGATGERVPPLANPLTGKQDGDVSTLDIQNALRFNNSLTLLTLTAEELLAVLEHGVANIGGGQTIQVGGIKFSYDPTLPENSRVQNAALIDDTGAVTQVIVENGAVAAGAPATIRVVTLNFLADGGDDYPFPATDRVDLDENGENDGFDDDGREQAAFATFLDSLSGPFDQPDTPPSEDERIQILTERDDTVLP